MKRLLILIILMSIGSSAFAQDPELFDNDWYLEELVIDSEVIPALYFPPEPKIGRIYFLNDLVRISFCDLLTSNAVYDMTQNFFTLDFWVILGEGCERQENVDFENLYQSIILDGNIFKNPFSYEIVPRGNGFLGLVVTNGEGDQAIYGNALLSLTDIALNEIEVYPNPTSSEIFIESQNDPVIRIQLFNLLGESIQSLTENTDLVDISNLAIGVYLLRVSTEQGSIVKKIVKQ